MDTSYTWINTKQQVVPLDTTTLLSPSDTNFIKSVVGSSLNYERAINNTILTDLNEIGTKKAHSTLHTKVKTTMLLDYLTTHSNGVLCYKASKMCLHIDTDVEYLMAPGEKSGIAGYFYLVESTSTSSPQASTINAPAHVVYKVFPLHKHKSWFIRKSSRCNSSTVYDNHSQSPTTTYTNEYR